jgi:glycosyltransferase involved in cell wall biosynthesis
LIELAVELRKLGLPFQIDIAGEGPLLQPCQIAVMRHNLIDIVRFKGHLDELSLFLRSLDIFITTSCFEGLPYALIDAMCASLPIIGFDAPGVCDVVAAGQTGILVPKGDIKGMAKQIFQLAQSTSYRSKLGTAARERAHRYFNIDRQVRELIYTYQSVLHHT